LSNRRLRPIVDDVTKKSRVPRRTAKFTDLWMLKDGAWKMSRILSFDHGPPSARRAAAAV
jgi:hypothetical protein